MCYAGASVGAAFIILWLATATNVLALTYTGAVIGWQMAAVRALSALLMAIAVGVVMTTSTCSRPTICLILPLLLVGVFVVGVIGALLLTGPGLSLPNWIAIARVFGLRKSVVYAVRLVVLGTLVGWLAGNLIWRS